jgi:hypothetical protein
MTDKCAVIASVCDALSRDALDAAVDRLTRDYPFAPQPTTPRKYGPVESTRVFVRDGFIDRYSGERLVFPPVLRLISLALPAAFPFHRNWKTDVTHPAYWEMGATIDHVIPVTSGGADDESNWVTTSMARNQAKQNWTLEQMGWTLHPLGDFTKWDGLIRWFLEATAQQPQILTDPKLQSIRQWHRAAQLVVLGSAPV